MSIPPGSKSPYLIQLSQVLLDPIGSLDRWSEEYGETFTLGGKKLPPTISFSTPEAIRTIFNAPSDTIGYSQKSELVKSLLGDGSFIFLPELEHQRQRKLIIPNWHRASLNTCGQNIIAITQKIIGNLVPGSAFDVRQVMKRISLEVILEEVFGSDNYLIREQIKQTLISLFELFDSPILASYLLTARFFPVLLEQELGLWGKVRHLQQKLDSLIYSEIAWRRNQKERQKYDLLSLLATSSDENGQSMSDKEIRDALLTLIFAGFETAAAAMSWMLYWIHYILGVREQVSNELNSSADFTKPMEIARLPYLEAVCNETLRINPPALSTFARTVKKPIEIDGYYLEPGTGIDVSIYLAHRRKAVYPEPNKFRPERFLKKQYSTYEFLPFGGGQCRCLGASLAQYEMKLVLATIVANFRLELIDPRPIRPKRHGIVILPSDLKMKVI
ncbi:cytochrome P450 [Pleurocapsa sp. PCC 7319]|uniref:cytochrome P450 n=1 Tax=Pleurocapsa sp. PCC 7319 TaxID=118161 RepID=UPI00034B519A|nr:cytochrome P450 [Pleurocapsa sp. PCC 7319]